MSTTYWYARGYYDGRSEGNEDYALQSHLMDEDWDAYDRGYEEGVSDYCRMDIVDQPNDPCLST